MEFLINYKTQDGIQTVEITAQNLDAAEKKANKEYPKWVDIRLKHIPFVPRES